MIRKKLKQLLKNMPKRSNEIRCCKCNAKLAEAEIEKGYVSIKCKCGVINLITVKPDKAPEKVERDTFHTPKQVRPENY